MAWALTLSPALARFFGRALFWPTGFDGVTRLGEEKIWPRVATENLRELTDIDGYRAEFLKLFGFGLRGVDYDADVDPHLTF